MTGQLSKWDGDITGWIGVRDDGGGLVGAEAEMLLGLGVIEGDFNECRE